MVLKSITLQNFKNLVNKSYNFTDSINLLIEPNGAGKSNFLEAITILSIGKAIRCDKEIDILSNNISESEIIKFASIKAEVIDDKERKEMFYYIQKLEESNKPIKELRIN